MERRSAEASYLVEPPVTDVEHVCEDTLCTDVVEERDRFVAALFLVEVDEAETAHIAGAEDDFVGEASWESYLVEDGNFEGGLYLVELWMSHACGWESVCHAWDVNALHEAKCRVWFFSGTANCVGQDCGFLGEARNFA